MSALAVEPLLSEISPDAPCGADLAYDPEFTALEASAQGKPERVMGEEVVPAQEPDWGAVATDCVTLLGRTKDLRLLVLLATAKLHTDGFAGFAQVLTLVSGLLERHWAFIHPQLEHDNEDDPTMRMNALAPLGHGPTMVALLRALPLMSSQSFGPVSLRDVEVAAGKMSPPANGDGRVLSDTEILAASRECAPEVLLQNMEALAQAADEANAIIALLKEKVGELHAPSLDPLGQFLADAHGAIQGWAAARGLGTVGARDDEVSVSADGAPGTEVVAGGPIRSRQDAIRALDSVSEYFRMHEPSSPVPLLVDRARRLISQDFMSIIKDLSPDAIAQIEKLSGSGGSGGNGNTDG